MERFALTINGQRHTVETDGDRPLLFVLRNQLGLCGTKYGCGEGECGACTVLLDGKPERSCVVPLSEVKGREVLTIEGLAPGHDLHPLQRAFLEVEAMQCGYCTAGMLMSAAALLQAQPNPTEAEIVEHMDGNICRCGTYERIIKAIQLAAAELAGAAQ
jgi:aerobic-type carbon monoxide dehydrogenase small subunit (CoxS/CutS family)